MNDKVLIKERRRMLMPRTSGWTGRRKDKLYAP